MVEGQKKGYGKKKKATYQIGVVLYLRSQLMSLQCLFGTCGTFAALFTQNTTRKSTRTRKRARRSK